jgi:hypothetical protein
VQIHRLDLTICASRNPGGGARENSFAYHLSASLRIPDTLAVVAGSWYVRKYGSEQDFFNHLWRSLAAIDCGESSRCSSGG